MELAGEAEKLTKRMHPRDDEAAERHAIDAFLGAINRSLAAEVQKLGGRTMEEVVAAARRIERILGEQPDSKIEQIILSMQDQIRILTINLQKAHEQMASQATAATPTAALAVPPAATVAAAQLSLSPRRLRWPMLTRLQPLRYHCYLPHNRSLTHLAASWILITGKKAPIFGLHADSQTGDLHVPSYATRRVILPIAAPLAPCCSAYCGNKPKEPPMAHPEARFLSFSRQKEARAPPRVI